MALRHLDPQVTARALGGAAAFVADAPPPSPNPGDLWIDRAGGYAVYAWAAGQWAALPLQAGSLAGLDYAVGPPGLFFYDPAVAYSTWGFEPDAEGWTGSGGTVAQSPSAARSGAFGLQLAATTGTSWSASSPPVACMPGAGVSVSAWAMAAQDLAAVGLQVSFYDSGGALLSTASAATVPLAAGTWTQLQYQAGAPAGTASAQLAVQDAESPQAGWLLSVDDAYLAGSLVVSAAPAAGTDPLGNPFPLGVYVAPGGGSVDGSVIADGTIPAGAVAFSATDIGGTTVTVGDQPATPQQGDLWFDDGSGFALNQWDGAAWQPYQFGSQALQAGSITADLLAANAIVAGMIAAGAIDGLTINAPVINAGTLSATDLIVSGANGGTFCYGAGGGGQQVQTFASSATWTAPAGVTTAKVEAWGGGGLSSAGSNTTGGGGGGGGGEYAAETSNTVVPGSSYAVTVGAAGSASSFSGPSATTVTAHAGGTASGRLGGAAGTGSANSVHRDGGAGAAGSPGTVTVTSLTGAGNWTVPAGVTSVQVQAYGPGSGAVGGGLAGGANSGGNGGAGGAYAASTVTVTPGGSVPYSVGTGGAGGSPNNFGHSGSGPTSWNSGQVLADYARVGGSGVSTSGTAAASTGAVKHGGGAAGTATGAGGAGGGSSGAAGQAGNAGSSNSGSSTVAGGAAPAGGYAGGGGGGFDSNGAAGSHAAGGGGGGGGSSAGNGGAGGNGVLLLTYTLPSNAGGGGGGGSGTSSATGNSGTAGSGASGGAGASAVSGGGPGGTGGNDGVTGAAPSAGPGGGGGGGGAAVAGSAGKPGQVRITWTQPGTQVLVASVTGASGTDPIAGATVPAGYMGPVAAIQPGSTPEAPETLHTASLAAGFTTSGSDQAPRYMIDAQGTVRLDGTAVTSAATAANATVFTLPAGYRPASFRRRFTGVTNASGYTLGGALWVVNTNGTVVLGPACSGAGQQAVLDGISFPTS